MNAAVKYRPIGLKKYDAMRVAIIEAKSVDECKSVGDRAATLEYYAKLAGDFEAERDCAQIRILAITRGGAFAKEAIKAKGPSVPSGSKRSGKGGKVTQLPQGNSVSLPITPKQSMQWQQLAQAPEKVQAYLDNEPDVPTISGALAAVQPIKRQQPKPKPYNPDFSPAAMRVWGLLRQLDEKDFPTSAKEFKGLDDCAKLIDRLIPKLKKLRGIL